MTADKANELAARIREAMPDCMVFVLNRGFGVDWVVTVEQPEYFGIPASAGYPEPLRGS